MKLPYEEFDLTGVRTYPLSSRTSKANAADFDFETDGFRAPTKDFIDGVEYDGRKPNAYIEKLTLGLKGQQKIEAGNVVGK